MLAVLAVYVLTQLALGLWIARRVATTDDYLVAGRRLGPLLATTSIFATWFGAESCVGAAGSVYHEGIGWHSVEPFAYGLCLCVLGLFFASRIWRTGVTTVADLFALRFGDRTATLAGLLMVPTSVLWAAAQIRAFGSVLAANSDGFFTPDGARLAAAAVVIVYTSAGGLMADVVTDLVQGIALVLGLGALLVAALVQLGGIGPAFDQLQALENAAPRAPAEPSGGLRLAEAWAIPVLGSLAAQETIARTLAARSHGLARNAAIGGGLVYLLVGAIPVTLGLLGPLLASGIEDGDAVLPSIARTHMPPVVNVLFAGALISAMLSTVDSSLLAASSVLGRNVIKVDRLAAPHRRLLLARALSVLCGVAAFFVSGLFDDVGDLVEEASGFGSAGLFVLFCIALRSRAAVPPAATLLCLASGVTAWVLGRYVVDASTPFLVSLAAAALGFAAGLLLAPMLPAARAAASNR